MKWDEQSFNLMGHLNKRPVAGLGLTLLNPFGTRTGEKEKQKEKKEKILVR
jgi:hypothetical protein